MAKIELRADLIASRYSSLSMGRGMVYSFETQEGLPVDAGNPLLRDLSPFTIRIVPPTLTPETTDVNLIGLANQSTEDAQALADSVRSMFGVSTVGGVGSSNTLATLDRIVAAGQVVASATSVTERAVLVDNVTAADIARQIERLLEISPLTLLVNPNNFTTAYTTVQQHTSRGRYGYLFERWGEAQTTLAFSGSTGAFIAAANPQGGFPGMTETSSVSGMQYAAKRESAAFQNFIALYQFYRNNGMVYDTIGKPIGGLMVGALAIDYDQYTYVGHINSFDYSYQEGMQHRLEWSLEFTVDYLYDHSVSPVVVQPHTSPQPNPSYPSRSAQSFLSRPDVLTGSVLSSPTAGAIKASGYEQFAQTPLQMLLPSQIKV